MRCDTQESDLRQANKDPAATEQVRRLLLISHYMAMLSTALRVSAPQSPHSPVARLPICKNGLVGIITSTNITRTGWDIAHIGTPRADPLVVHARLILPRLFRPRGGRAGGWRCVQLGMRELAARIATSLCRYSDDLPADRTFFEAGFCCRVCTFPPSLPMKASHIGLVADIPFPSPSPYLSPLFPPLLRGGEQEAQQLGMAHVFLNRYLDLSEVIDDPDMAGLSPSHSLARFVFPWTPSTFRGVPPCLHVGGRGVAQHPSRASNSCRLISPTRRHRLRSPS